MANLIPTPKGKSNTTLPLGQINLAALSVSVSDNWNSQNPNRVFSFVTKTDFGARATSFNNVVAAKRAKLAERKVLTENLGSMQKDINKRLKDVKQYLSEEYSGASLTAHLATFGFVVENGRYTFPSDRDELIVSLEALVNNFQLNPNLANRKYGYTYWKDLLVEFKLQWSNARTMDSFLADLTLQIHADYDILLDHLRRMKAVTKADYPKTYKLELRKMGFQSEKF